MTPGEKRDCSCPRARHQHGTRAAFDSCGCRCLPCRVAYAQAVLDVRHGATRDRELPLLPRAGTRRRLEALHAIGWDGKQLAALLGISGQAVFDLRTKPTLVYPGTAEKVAALYDELWDQYPTGTIAERTARWARRKGFVPPLAWDDDEIDNPNAQPHTPTGRRLRDLRPCGTQAAARRHQRRGEPLCQACKAAQSRREDEAA